jgi:Protein of unknown function (DUF3833)
MKRLACLSTLLLATLLAACGGVNPEVYKDQGPRLELSRYFNGTIDAWGVFTDRSGKVVKRFTVVMHCNWQGDTGTLDEDFTYSDGTRAKRVWTLRKLADGRFVGSAPDVIGQAQGVTSGNALNWKYVLRLKVDDSTYDVNFDDWMYLMDDEVMLNRAVMSKFGVTLGEVTLSFRKRH